MKAAKLSRSDTIIRGVAGHLRYGTSGFRFRELLSRRCFCYGANGTDGARVGACRFQPPQTELGSAALQKSDNARLLGVVDQAALRSPGAAKDSAICSLR